MYSCGPTVYQRIHIGNVRSFLLSDIVRRVFEYEGFEVEQVMNITDVGHLTEELTDSGEDKLEREARKAGTQSLEIAKKYTDLFLKDINALNITRPSRMPKASEYIEEMITLVKTLEERGFVYRTSDGIYFDTSKLADYGKLATMDLNKLKEGARVEKNPEKKNATDFALWKFSSEEERDQEWESPWGVGFPGWHLECSVMSVKFLGQPFDIHTGGVDLRETHHPNEIAQSKAASGKELANYWIHGEFVLMDEEKMAKSEGNAFTLGDLKDRGIDPLALRYLYLTAHYRTQIEFSWDSLEASERSLNNLRTEVSAVVAEGGVVSTKNHGSSKDVGKPSRFKENFLKAVTNDFNMPEALSILHKVMDSKLTIEEKYQLAMEFDKVLGLDLASVPREVPESVLDLVAERAKAREAEDFEKADNLRNQISKEGFVVEDREIGPVVKRKFHLK